jgi:hypothetical protein
MADQADPRRVDVGASGKQIDGRSVARDLGADARRIGLRVRWIAGPGEAALRQEGDRAVLARQADSLIDELGPVPVRRLGVEPVKEEDRRTTAAASRLDERRLAVVREAEIVDPRAVALVDARDVSHRCRSARAFRGSTPMPSIRFNRRAHEVSRRNRRPTSVTEATVAGTGTLDAIA